MPYLRMGMVLTHGTVVPSSNLSSEPLLLALSDNGTWPTELAKLDHAAAAGARAAARQRPGGGRAIKIQFALRLEFDHRRA